MSVTRSHSLSIGIVGLPNAGKSTLFNSLTENSVPAENFPFCTIDKNVGVVEVPDEKLEQLVTLYKPEKTVPAAIKFVDIAGLVKGASEGEGLGNQFLSHIREVDVIMYVLRGFKSDTISHVYERIDPWDDFQIVQTELILRDIETVQNKASDVGKKARVSKDREVEVQMSALEKLQKSLGEGVPALEVDLSNDEREFVDTMFLLSMKPRIFVINVREGMGDDEQEDLIESFKEQATGGQIVLSVDVKALGEVSAMSEKEKEEYFELLGSKITLTEDVIKAAYKKLDLITFYTGSEKECNAWSIVRGANAKEAAGVIHTDLSEGFVTADVVNVEKLVEIGGFHEAKENGLVRNQGRDYAMEDGDYMVVYSH